MALHQYGAPLANFQVWCCNTCTHRRVWGWGSPMSPDDHNAVLWCSICRRSLVHSFQESLSMERCREIGIEYETRVPSESW